jgi:hypothetical protein
MDERFATVASYPTQLEAELAAAALREDGMEARLRDVHAHVTGALANVKLDVPSADAERAARLLASIEARDTDELSDEPRCPACESTYLRERGGRWQCQRCSHAFEPEDAAEPLHGAGPESYRLRSKRPPQGQDVFRLRRSHQGVGLFIGLLLGFVGGLGAGLAPALGAILGGLAGWALGRAWVHFVCSDARCRVRLRSDTRQCPGCGAVVHQQIARAADHWVERAALRRARE